MQPPMLEPTNQQNNTMKKLSETYKELGIAFAFPIQIKDSKGNATYIQDSHGYWCRKEYNSDGNETYYENSDGLWYKYEYDSDGNQTYYKHSNGYWHKNEYDAVGNQTYHENSNGYWCKNEYDSKGNVTYHETSHGNKRGTPRNKTCDGKVIEVDGIKYELKLKN